MAWNQIAKVFDFESAFEARGKEAAKWGNKGSENAWNFDNFNNLVLKTYRAWRYGIEMAEYQP